MRYLFTVCVGTAFWQSFLFGNLGALLGELILHVMDKDKV